MKDINWSVSNEDRELILAIVKRAKKFDEKIDVVSLQMDIVATHNHIQPLRLEEWLNSDDFNFLHDVAGIMNHLNRETVELERCWYPRFSQ